MKQNPYQKFKIPGVKGSVPGNFESVKIYDKTGESLVIYIGSLEADAYDFGYELNLKDGTHLRKLPGVGSGWFKLKDHAMGYALNGVFNAFYERLSDPMRIAIRTKINQILLPQLDLL